VHHKKVKIYLQIEGFSIFHNFKYHEQTFGAFFSFVFVFRIVERTGKGKTGIYLDLKDAPVPGLMELIRKYEMGNDIHTGRILVEHKQC
jgi:hypothetical protein